MPGAEQILKPAWDSRFTLRGSLFTTLPLAEKASEERATPLDQPIPQAFIDRKPAESLNETRVLSDSRDGMLELVPGVGPFDKEERLPLIPPGSRTEDLEVMSEAQSSLLEKLSTGRILERLPRIDTALGDLVPQLIQALEDQQSRGVGASADHVYEDLLVHVRSVPNQAPTAFDAHAQSG